MVNDTKSRKMQLFMNENDSAIDSWKDTRLRKLEDFTRDLMATANSKNSSVKGAYRKQETL